MKIIFSPTKLQKTPKDSDIVVSSSTKILFPGKSQKLIQHLRGFSLKQIKKIFSLSDNLANQVYDYYQNFNDIQSPALHTFSGTSFKQLEPRTYTAKQQDYLNSHLIILSALYGALRPNDKISPYRLDMYDDIGIGSLYEFWADSMIKIFKDEDTIINLASQEYASMIPNTLRKNMITIEFLVQKGSQTKSIAMHAKRQRGKILNWMTQNLITQPKHIQKYSSDGFMFSPKLSNTQNYVFLRIE